MKIFKKNNKITKKKSYNVQETDLMKMIKTSKIMKKIKTLKIMKKDIQKLSKKFANLILKKTIIKINRKK